MMRSRVLIRNLRTDLTFFLSEAQLAKLTCSSSSAGQELSFTLVVPRSLEWLPPDWACQAVPWSLRFLLAPD